MNFTNELSILPDNKEALQIAISDVLSDLESGTISPLKLKIKFKYFEKLIEGVKEKLDELALDEAQTYNEKEFKMLGAKISLREVSVKYDFENCGDGKYLEYSQKKSILDRDMKARQKFLLSLTGKHIEVDAESGETFEIYPPAKSSTTQTVISI